MMSTIHSKQINIKNPGFKYICDSPGNTLKILLSIVVLISTWLPYTHNTICFRGWKNTLYYYIQLRN
jgi:hypothetical protein